MKLDVNVLRYLSKDEFRVLTAVEMGMKNHEIVPAELVERIAGLKRGGAYKNIKSLLKHKLVHHDSSNYDGYRLTYSGYDFLAIKTLVNRGLITGVGRQIGVGKESDIHEVVTEDGQTLALKLHRLGRTSFRAVKSKRDYLRHRNSYSWLYLSRLAALKEFAFMKALGERGFSVPQAVDWNRHCVLMTLVPGYPIVQVKELTDPPAVFNTVIGLIVRLAELGLIHCDFNEFNIMIDENENVTMIDFPQMVSVSHRNAEMYFDRDVECIFKFFGKRFNYSPPVTDEDDDGRPVFADVANVGHSLDKELEASGFTRQNQDVLDQFVETNGDESGNGHESGNEDNSQDVDESDEEVLVSGVAGHQSGAENLVVEVGSGLERLGITSDDELGTGPAYDAVKHKESLDSVTDPKATQQETNPSSGGEDDDSELQKRIRKHRQRAVAAMHRTKTLSSRNSSKDKGGKRSRHARAEF